MFSSMFSRTTTPVVIRIEFPALDNFVAFLRDNEQRKIDAMTAEIRGSVTQLKSSGDALQQAIANEQK